MVVRADETRERVGVAGVLAGGRSLRMGCPKALLRLPDERTLIEHVVGVAGEVSGEVVILGAGAPLPPTLQGLRVLADVTPDAGPLVGLCALLRYAGDSWALLMGCDLPWAKAESIRGLLRRAAPTADAVAYVSGAAGRFVQPCLALYHTRIAALAEEALRSGDRSLHGLLERIRCERVEVDEVVARELTSVNTPQEYACLLAGTVPADDIRGVSSQVP